MTPHSPSASTRSARHPLALNPRRSPFRRSLLVALLMIPAAIFAGIDPAQLQQAQEKLRSWRNDEARTAFEALASIEPNNAEVQRSLGVLALRQSRWDDALRLLETALKLDPALAHQSEFHCDLGDAHGLLAATGNVFGKLGHAKKCRLGYEKAVELDASNIRARWSLMEFYRQAPTLLGGGVDKAYAQALAIKEVNPVKGRFAHAVVLIGDKKIPDAFALYAAVAPSSSDDYTALVQLGQLALVTGQQTDLGLAALRRSLELEHVKDEPWPSQVQFFIGKLLQTKGDKAGARAAFEASLKIDPKFEPARAALVEKS